MRVPKLMIPRQPLIALIIALAFVTGACSSVPDVGVGVATLTWTVPTKNTDGTPIDDLAGYHILYGRSADDLRYSVRVNDATTTRYVIDKLGAGTWYFTIIAVNAEGRSSEKSNIASKTMP